MPESKGSVLISIAEGRADITWARVRDVTRNGWDGVNPTTEEILMSLEQHIPADYLDYTGRDDLLSGGVKLIPLSRRPRAPSRSLDQADRQFPGDEDAAPAGGTSSTHEYLEAFDSYFPADAGIEYYY
jgi:hypothetical protein